MRTKLFFLILLAFIGRSSFAQTNLDSLENSLKASQQDSLRFTKLIKLSQEYQFLNFLKAEEFSAQALAMAEKKNWEWAKPIAYARAGYIATISGDYTSAIKYDNNNLQLVISKKDSAAIAEALNFLGNDYNDLGKYDEAYYYFTQSYRVARAINDSLRMAISTHNIGAVLNDMGQYDLALDHFKFSQAISEKIDDLDGIPYVTHAVGEVHLNRKDFKKAEEHFLSALKQIRERKITIIESKTFKLLAELYFQTKDYTKALQYYDSAAQLYTKTSNEFGVAEVNLGISTVYTAQNKFDEARKLIEESLQTAKRFNAKKMEINCFNQLSILAEKKGDYKAALAFHKNFKVLEDSLFSQEMQEKLFQDQLRFQTETKDIEIAALSKAKAAGDSAIRRQELVRNILVVVVALTAILLFTVYRSGQRRIRINKLLVEHQEEIKKRSIELEQLNQVKDKFFSIISHDLRSPMNALSGILDLVDQKQLTEAEFGQLTKELKVQFNHTRTLINNLLDWALLQMDKLKIQQEKVDLNKLVDETFKLLSSYQMKEMKLVNQVPANTLAWADLSILNLVLRNLIINGIKFSERGGVIEVFTSQEKDNHIIGIRDYGVGINPEVQKILFEKTSGYSTRGTANEKGTGLGLILCKEFVERNGGRIWLESEEGKGSTFYFTIRKA